MVQEYLRAFTLPGTIRAGLEDYRAAATRDFEDDERDLGKRVRCPLLAIWGEFGKMHTMFDVLATWKEKARARRRAIRCRAATSSPRRRQRSCWRSCGRSCAGDRLCQRSTPTNRGRQRAARPGPGTACGETNLYGHLASKVPCEGTSPCASAHGEGRRLRTGESSLNLQVVCWRCYGVALPAVAQRGRDLHRDQARRVSRRSRQPHRGRAKWATCGRSTTSACCGRAAWACRRPISRRRCAGGRRPLARGYTAVDEQPRLAVRQRPRRRAGLRPGPEVVGDVRRGRATPGP